ncbi:MAG: hypothetical protein C0404_03085 [Verrucomicrobia bacterium]|nr:hypothetical protein [Verrucomicrobiota bacterium]
MDGQVLFEDDFESVSELAAKKWEGVFWAKNSEGRRIFDLIEYVDGELKQRNSQYYEGFFIGCGLGDGKAMIDNVVVRMMIRSR